jgi:hypothetical protein
MWSHFWVSIGKTVGMIFTGLAAAPVRDGAAAKLADPALEACNCCTARHQRLSRIAPLADKDPSP